MTIAIDWLVTLLVLSVAFCRLEDARRRVRLRRQDPGFDFASAAAKAMFAVFVVMVVAAYTISGSARDLWRAIGWLLFVPAGLLALAFVGAAAASYLEIRRFIRSRLGERGEWVGLLDLLLVASLLSVGGFEIPHRALIAQSILGGGAVLFLLGQAASWARSAEDPRAAEHFAALPSEVQGNQGLGRARLAMIVAGRILPARLAREELGDALERAVALAREGAPSWRIDRLWVAGVAIAVGNALRELPRAVFRMKPRA